MDCSPTSGAQILEGTTETLWAVADEGSELDTDVEAEVRRSHDACAFSDRREMTFLTSVESV